MRWWKKLARIKENIRRNEDLETPYRFAERVLTVSLPTAMMLLILVWADEVRPSSAIVGFGMVVTLTIVLALPFFTNLQSVTQYIKEMAEEKDFTELPRISSKDDESAHIVAAINQMRTIWATKTERLEAQTLSDAAVLDSLPDPLMMLDQDAVIIGANLAARQTFGFSVRGKMLKEVLNDKKMQSTATQIIEGKIRKKSLEIGLGDRTYNAKIERLPAEARAGAVAVLTFYDMTAQKQFEQMQADFVANASHELRTPLSILSGFVETLQGTAREDEESREKFLKIMQTQSTRMSALIESLLSLSRLQMNENEKLTENVEIPNILRDVKQMLDTKAETKGSNIVLKLCAQPKSVMGNAGELTQVFQNLTDNALKYGQSASTVMLSCRFDEKYFYVQVHNTGNPINPASIPHIFERFYRVSENKNKAQGTGLGLAIVAQIIKHHNGEIKVESSNETGTNFTVCLPLLPDTCDSKESAELTPAS